MTEFLTARTCSELRELAPTGQLLAGGTDLLVQMRSGRVVRRLIDISNLQDGPPAVEREDGRVRISALASLTTVVHELAGALPGLAASVRLFGSEQIRNRATIGGNLANASPAADILPPLAAAGAMATLNGSAGTRVLPVEDLALGPGRTALRTGEWIETIDLALPAGDEGFRKLGGRQAMAISVASLAWRWRCDDDGRLHDVALALGAVAPRVIRATDAEAELEGRPPVADAVDRAVAALGSQISPIDDVRASAWYRRAVAGALLREALVIRTPQRRSPGSAVEGTWTSA